MGLCHGRAMGRQAAQATARRHTRQQTANQTMTKTARIATTALAACAIALAGAAYFALDPATNAIFPRCPFLTLTGLKCPGMLVVPAGP